MSRVEEVIDELIRNGQKPGSGEKIVGRLTFHVLVERGIANLNAGRVFSKRSPPG